MNRPRRTRDIIPDPAGGTGFAAYCASQFRKASCVLLAAALLVTFYTLLFADVPVGRNGKPKPPLRTQLMWDAALIGAALPGVAWGLWRAVKSRQRTPWE